MFPIDSKHVKQRIIPIIIVLIVIYCFYQLKAVNKKYSPRYVIFDLGANIGDSARYLVDPNFQESPHKLKAICSKDKRKWEIHSFEANPDFNHHLEETKKLVESLGHKHYLYKETAAWVRDETMTFYLDKINKLHNYWGSSLHKEHDDAKQSGYKNIQVKALDISTLLLKYTEQDFIIMKIDIEGSEYELLKHLIRQKTIFLIDIISVEFHDIKFNNDSISLTHSQRVNFYLQFFKIFKIEFVDWLLGHLSFLPAR